MTSPPSFVTPLQRRIILFVALLALIVSFIPAHQLSAQEPRPQDDPPLTSVELEKEAPFLPEPTPTVPAEPAVSSGPTPGEKLPLQEDQLRKGPALSEEEIKAALSGMQTTVNVPAYASSPATAWVSTGITVQRGQVLVGTASGTWCYTAGAGCFTADGNDRNACGSEPHALNVPPYYNLIMRSGSSIQALGTVYRVVIQETGLLYLAYNDCYYPNNTGSVNAVFTIGDGSVAPRFQPPFRGPADCGGIAPNPDNVNGTSVADPVRISDGAFWLTIPCLSLGGAGMPINIGLRYDTALWNRQEGSPTIGYGWTVSYRRSLSDTSDAEGEAWTLLTENNEQQRYRPLVVDAATFANPPAPGAFYDWDGNFTRLYKQSDTGDLMIQTRDGSRQYFSPTGVFLREEDRLGNALVRTTATEESGTLFVETYTNNRTGQSLRLEHREETVDGFGVGWRLIRITDGPTNGGPARSISLTYGASGNDLNRLIAVTDAGDRVWTFQYDSLGRIATFYSPAQNPAILGAAAKATVNVYDDMPYDLGRVVQQTLPSGTIVDFDWAPGAGIYNVEITYRDADSTQSRIQRYLFNPNGQLKRIYIPNSIQHYHELNYSYAIPSLVTEMYDPERRRTSYSHDYSTGDLLFVTHFPYAPPDYTDPHQERWQYNEYGQTVRYTDTLGYETVFNYNADGTLASIAALHKFDATKKQETLFSYDPVMINGTAVGAGLVTAITLPDGTRNTQAYDTFGYPTIATYDADRPGHIGLKIQDATSYDWRGFLVAARDPRGITTRYEYDHNPAVGQYGALGWASAIVTDPPTSIDGAPNPDAHAVRTAYRYDALGHITQRIDDAGTNRLNATWSWEYTPIGTEAAYDIARSIDPLGNIVEYQYNPFGNISAMIERDIDRDPTTADDRATAYSYTPEGWLDWIEAADGRRLVDNSYSPSGLLTYHIGPNGTDAFEYRYDGKGRIIRKNHGSIYEAYTYIYDANDNVIAMTDPSGVTMQWHYASDPYGRLAWEGDGGKHTTYTYDDATTNRNWVTSVNSGNHLQSVTTDYQYDALGRLTTKITDPGAGQLNLTTTFEYDLGLPNRWDLQQVTDPNGNATAYRYNTLGQLDRVTDALGQQTQYQYNNLNHVVGMTPPTGAPTTYAPDLKGQVLSLTRNGQTESWAYRADGSIAAQTDFSGQNITYGYDATGRLVSIDYAGTPSDPDGARSDATFTYTDNDLLASATSKPNGQTSESTLYTYNRWQSLQSRTRTGRTVTYNNSPNGNTNSIDYWGQGNVSYEYDGAGRVIRMNPWNTYASHYFYRGTSQLERVARPASGQTFNAVTTYYEYDTASRLINLKFQRSSLTPFENITYELDNNGNRTSMTDSTGTHTYLYDQLDRLTSATEPALPAGPLARETQYSYDAVGNRTSVATTITATDKIWIDDALPNGAVAVQSWNWSATNPPPQSGSAAHSDGPAAGIHQHYFMYATEKLNVAAGDTLFAYVYLDPANPPRQVMLQWNEAHWEHRAYWGENLIPWGTNGTQSRYAMGPLPATGQWVRLEVPASLVGLEGRAVHGMAFTLYDGHATFDSAGLQRSTDNIPSLDVISHDASDRVIEQGFTYDANGNLLGDGENIYTYDAANRLMRSTSRSKDHVWIDDTMPIIWGQATNNWQWITNNPKPESGTHAHQTAAAAGLHQHVVLNQLHYTIAADATFFAYVYLDPANPPRQVMLQWNDGQTQSWEHRAYWGENLISWGTDGTQSRRRMGDLPPTGQWVRLEVPASAVGLAGRTVRGFAFTLYDGRATFDQAGVTRPGPTTEYQYDALGNLIRQIVTQDASSTVTDFVLDERGPNAQVLGTISGDTTTLYAYGPDGLHAQKVGASISYAHSDGLGSVIAWTAATDGAVLSRTHYDPWGAVRATRGPEQAFGFTGEQQLSSGIVHLRARSYSPALGRFLQRDSFAGFPTRPQSLNRYAYVENNPLNFVDPSGHTKEEEAPLTPLEQTKDLEEKGLNKLVDMAKTHILDRCIQATGDTNKCVAGVASTTLAGTLTYKGVKLLFKGINVIAAPVIDGIKDAYQQGYYDPLRKKTKDRMLKFFNQIVPCETPEAPSATEINQFVQDQQQQQADEQAPQNAPHAAENGNPSGGNNKALAERYRQDALALAAGAKQANRNARNWDMAASGARFTRNQAFSTAALLAASMAFGPAGGKVATTGQAAATSSGKTVANNIVPFVRSTAKMFAR